jgi:3-methyladenine DNA glycosylase AlkD
VSRPPPNAARRLTAAALQARLRAVASARYAKIAAWFFKTGPGEYGEGDVFIGVRAPAMHRIVRDFVALPLPQVRRLLRSKVHEDRMAAVLVLARRAERADDAHRRELFDFYLAHAERVNNWDLVDGSAPQVVGGYSATRRRGALDRLARSANLWERRIAIVATLHLIRLGQFDDTLRIAARLLSDEHDLIHKAAGWMLREVGKRDCDVLRGFLRRHAAAMPRTMLRYAIERMTPAERKKWMAKKA